MAENIRSEVREIIDRCRAIDVRNPRHDPDRALAAYRRRLTAAGIDRRVRWIADPSDAVAWDIAFNRATKAWRTWAATVASPGSELWTRDMGSYPVEILRNSDWNPWDTASGPEHQWHVSGEAYAAKLEWEAAVGWAAKEAERSYRPWYTPGPAAVREGAASWDAGAEWAMTAWTKLVGNNPALNAALGWATIILNPAVAPSSLSSSEKKVVQTFLNACNVQYLWAFSAVVAAWDSTTAWDAGIAVRCLNLARREKTSDRLISVYAPMIDAYEAGAFAHSLLDSEVVVLAAPAISQNGGQLLKDKRPALEWPRTKVYA